MLAGSGNEVVDLSGNGNTGTFAGNPIWVPGKFGPVPQLDGAGDYINTTFNGTEYDELTISAWIRSGNPGVGGTQYIVDNSPGANGYILRRNSDSTTIAFFAYSNDAHGSIGVTCLNQGNWHHVVGVHNATHNKIYLDGVLGGTTAYDASSGIDDSASTMVIGAEYDNAGGLEWIGEIDVVSIYKRAFIASEVTQLYSQPFCMFKDPAEIALLGGYQAAPPATVVPQLQMLRHLWAA